jgi:hypothetical protein
MGGSADTEEAQVLNGWAHRENFGYRIIETTEGGPAHLSGIDKFLDFIVY